MTTRLWNLKLCKYTFSYKSTKLWSLLQRDIQCSLKKKNAKKAKWFHNPTKNLNFKLYITDDLKTYVTNSYWIFSNFVSNEVSKPGFSFHFWYVLPSFHSLLFICRCLFPQNVIVFLSLFSLFWELANYRSQVI